MLLVLLYYVGGAIWVHKIDDDPSFGAETVVPESASRAVAVAADLIDREVNQNRWVANDPFFQPGYLLDNMPAYQTGIVSAVGRFTTELRDRVARVRGSSAVDPRSRERRRSDQLSRRRVDLRVVGHAGAAELGEPVSPRAGGSAPLQ